MFIFSKIGKFFNFIFYNIRVGLYYICLIFSRGFFFLLSKIALILKNIFFNFILFDKLANLFSVFQEKPQSFLFVLIIFVLSFSFSMLTFGDTNKLVKLSDQAMGETIDYFNNVDEVVEDISIENNNQKTFFENNLFKKYGEMNINNINFNDLNAVNSDIVSWLSVDGTNINYPIVQTTDNDYYLSYNINKIKDSRGWTFLDYRNDYNMNDHNTIFYGHNLLNKTGFGSISNVFTNEWFSSSNHLIKVFTSDKVYTYEIFSVYYSNPDNYYLQTSFSNDESYELFLQTLFSKSEIEFSLDVLVSDRIITLSTCTEDNTGRKVVHAKLVSESFR